MEIQKTSSQKPSPEYLRGYNQGYLMKQAAEGEAWHQSLLRNWQNIPPEYKRWISAGLGGLLGGGGGALGGRMFGGKGMHVPLLGLLGALIGGYGGYKMSGGKRDYMGEAIGGVGKGYESLFGGKPAVPGAPSGPLPSSTGATLPGSIPTKANVTGVKGLSALPQKPQYAPGLPGSTMPAGRTAADYRAKKIKEIQDRVAAQKATTPAAG